MHKCEKLLSDKILFMNSGGRINVMLQNIQKFLFFTVLESF